MTPRQMFRVMREHHIGLIFDPGKEVWVAGETVEINGRWTDGCMTVELRVEHQGRGPFRHEHSSPSPAGAVEDYCNARNLEWDI